MPTNTILSDEKINIAINGFGRIGRQFFKNAIENPNINVVAINDLGDIQNQAYLLKYDSVYGTYSKNVQVEGNYLIVGNKKVLHFSEKDPNNLPWQKLNISVVVESTGVFNTTEKASAHINAGAKRVVISAPAKDEQTPTATPNVNMDATLKAKITSNASCTTNAATPVAIVMDEAFGIDSALLNTVHGYTATQAIVDTAVQKDFRRGRAAAVNMIPTSSGAAVATERAVPQIKGKMDAMAIRVPVVSGSILDFTFISKTNTSIEQVNNAFIKASQSPQWQGILNVEQNPIVSTDILQSPYGSTVDLPLTRVANKRLVKVLAWYDNEWGYVNMLLKHVLYVGKQA